MSNQAPYLTLAATAGFLGSAYLAYKLYQETRRTKLPKVWKKVGTLKNLYAYPIKSCGPVLLTKAEVTTLGLKDGWLRDRFLMIVDEKNNFITARTYPELLTVQPVVRNSILTLKHADMDTVHVNLAEVIALQTPKTACVWKVPVPVYDCGSEVSEWISRLLSRASQKFRLVYYAAQESRPLRENKVYKINKQDTGALPDEVAFNLINNASVEDLNTRVKDSEITPRNFRPNFVLTGANPYEEDNWKFIKIGESIFEVLMPCRRCLLTTIDPETGVRNVNTEPLETLKRYRQIEDPIVRKAVGNAPRMGLQMTLRSGSGAVISLDDDVYVA